MKTNIELDDGFLPIAISNEIKKIVVSSLDMITTNGRNFIINDKIFLRSQSNGKITPCVMNSASYISKSFQRNLASHKNCQGETKLLDQSFDGLIKSHYSGVAYRLKDSRDVIDVANEYIKLQRLDPKAIYNLFPMLYGMYVERECFNVPALHNTLHLFVPKHVNHTYTIGVEFETGNVASSFRAINKLNTLFHQGVIDGGCFITSTDKTSSATRIWPVSNRNGSFQELKQRAYKNQIALPLICIGFAPDGFSPNVGFLSNTGSIYHLTDTGNVDQNTQLKIFKNNDGVLFFSSL